ncbi:MAG: zf-HC2 domain-containing protein [Ignavibacteria bacterium]|nr:zf-HC2 domain-containing protein [Ignavibacteria bacterium]
MKCHIENREELISQYLMNELSAEKMLRFEEHYFKCEVCFAELKAAENALNLIAKEGSNAFATAKQIKTKSIFSFIPAFSTTAKIGFAFAAFALLFVLYFVLKTETTQPLDTNEIITETQKEPEHKVDTPKTQMEKSIEPDKNLIAELSGPDFNPSPYYEEWINENVRSEKILVEKVISPKNNDKYSNQFVLFEWRMTENVPVNLVIVNNDDDIIFAAKVPAENFPKYSISVKPNDLKKSGLYYWRIEDEIEVLYLGKFYFIKQQ